MLTLLIFIVILCVLVFVHEFGHFITARRAGIRVDEFGFGLPPRIFGYYRDPLTKRWRRAGMKTHLAPSTIYSINWIPLGGFVKIKGEQGEYKDESDSFAHALMGKKVLILSAGVLMNVALAATLFIAGFMIGVPKELDESINYRIARVKNEQILISGVLKDSPAEKAGMVAGDIIKTIDGKEFAGVEDIQQHIQSSGDAEITISVTRSGILHAYTLLPQPIGNDARPIIGVDLTHIGIVSYPWYISVWEGIRVTGFFMQEIIRAFFNLIKNLILTQQVSVDLSGPVGIAVMTGEVTRLGFIYVIQFMALLSLNLAIINFLPFPALDGGRVFFLLIEKIRGKPVNAKTEAFIHSIGLYILLLLVVFVTYKDILRFSDTFKNLWESIKNVF